MDDQLAAMFDIDAFFEVRERDMLVWGLAKCCLAMFLFSLLTEFIYRCVIQMCGYLFGKYSYIIYPSGDTSGYLYMPILVSIASKRKQHYENASFELHVFSNTCQFQIYG